MAGREYEQYSPKAARFSDMLPGCYDPAARLADMDRDGIEASRAGRRALQGDSGRRDAQDPAGQRHPFLRARPLVRAGGEAAVEGPLSGIKVLEVAQWWFVPAGGAVLSDWGADVIKIEHPVTGDAQRGLAAVGWKSTEGNVDFMMQQSNRGKRSVGLDIATPGGPDREKGGYDATAFWSRGGVGDALTPPAADSPVRTAANPVGNPYRTRDGRWIMLMMLHGDEHWEDFCRHIDRSDLVDHPRYANHYLREVEGGDRGRFDLVASPVQFDRQSPALGPSPEMGQHTEEVLLELGLCWQEIGEHKRARAIL